MPDGGGTAASATPISRAARWAGVIVPVLLVLALFCLVLGILTSTVPVVIASVVLSAVAVVFIGLGALRLRPHPERASRSNSVAHAAAVPDATLDDLVAGDADADAHDAGSAGENLDVVTPDAVWVVPGLARYHRGACVQIIGKPAEPRSLEEVLDAGLTACSLCAPPTAVPRARL